MLEKFDKARQEIESVIENMRKNQALLFPARVGSAEVGLEYLEDVSTALRKGKFYVSVCGQIKAGKSTLLNVLLFGHEVLPTDVTPETATLTMVTRGSSFHAKITFYSAEEWARLNSNSDFKEYYADQLSEMEAGGVQPSNYLGRTVEEVDIEALDKYVSDGGMLTLLVKQVEITHPSVPHDGLVFVDTPGLNDPNVVRSQVTIDWIGKSDAVLFVLHSRGIDEDDYSFMDESLAAISSESFILVLNRIDQLNRQGRERVEDYVRGALDSGSLGDKKLISGDTGFVSISSLAALLARTPKVNLSEKAQWELSRLEKDNTDLLEKEGYFAELEKAISDKLFDGKGRNLLRTNANKLMVLVKSKLHFNQISMERVETQIDDIDKTLDELKLRIDDLSRIKQRLDQRMKQMMGRLDEQATKAYNNLFKIIDEAFKTAEDDLRILIHEAENPKELAKCLPWKIRESLERELIHGRRLESAIDMIGCEIDAELQTFRKELMDELKQDLPGFLKFITFHFDLPTISDEIREVMKESVYEKFRACISKLLGFLWVRKQETRGNLYSELHPTLDDIENGVRESVKNVAISGYKVIGDEVSEELGVYISNLQDDVRYIMESKNKGENTKTLLEKRRQELADIELGLERLYDHTNEALRQIMDRV